MSIIWEPHQCEPKREGGKGWVTGALWECPVCGTVWAYEGMAPGGTNGMTMPVWVVVGDQYNEQGRSQEDALRESRLARGRYSD